MIPFKLMKTIWDVVEVYNKKGRKIKHPVECPVQFDSYMESVKVILIPTYCDNYSYLLVFDKQAIIIDPSDFKPISHEIIKRDLKVPYILITHDHIDHIGGIIELQKAYNSEVLAAKGVCVPCPVTEIVSGCQLNFGNSVIKAISVPGHIASQYHRSSANNIAWYMEKAGVLFTGDTLFSCGYGFTSSDKERNMWESLMKLRNLPDETMIFCGHEYTLQNLTFAIHIDPENTLLKRRFENVNRLLKEHRPTLPVTLSIEKAINPFLRWDDRALKKRLQITDKDDYDVFLHIRNIKCAFNKKLQKNEPTTTLFEAGVHTAAKAN